MSGFWIFMLAMDMLIPVVMVAFGLVFMHRPPENINRTYGYRTRMSMRSEETWVFAHRYCGRLWVIFGIAVFAVTVVVFAFIFNEPVETAGMVGFIVCMAQIIPLVAAIVPTEIALRRNFDGEGRRKNGESR